MVFKRKPGTFEMKTDIGQDIINEYRIENSRRTFQGCQLLQMMVLSSDLCR